MLRIDSERTLREAETWFQDATDPPGWYCRILAEEVEHVSGVDGVLRLLNAIPASTRGPRMEFHLALAAAYFRSALLKEAIL
jgi:hypothetical protein